MNNNTEVTSAPTADRKLVSVAIPCYNEEATLPMFYAEMTRVANMLPQYHFEFIFVDDGSKDGTAEKIMEMRREDKRVHLLSLSRNFGKEMAMLAAMDYARGDCFITIDADLQEPPATLPAMLAKWEEGYDDVYGSRRHRQQGFMKRVSSRAYHGLLEHLSDVSLQQDAGDFRLLDRRCVEALKSIREGERYTKGLYSWIGFNKTSVDYDIAPRAAGNSKWNLHTLFRLALDGITSHSLVPLRMASYMGVLVSLAAFLFLIWVVVKALVMGDPVAGYPSLMAVLLFLGGTILLAIGIIGEYLGRIFMETKRRPPYFIKSVNGNTHEFKYNAPS